MNTPRLDDFLKEVPDDYTAEDFEERYIAYRDSAAAELAALKAENAKLRAELAKAQKAEAAK